MLACRSSAGLNLVSDHVPTSDLTARAPLQDFKTVDTAAVGDCGLCQLSMATEAFLKQCGTDSNMRKKGNELLVPRR